ncbi:hypothetical protein ACPPVU_05945 [Mucilaginibacter sp. McL0603]|uniref:hypothetical protein n=1 Tax=Mucilaginibacter sp. McL0603 TaxID=3415670 RepID=UPI003CE8D256
MKSFYKALLVLSFLPLITFAQSNYKPGYVVTLKGDTLRGFIDYREWNTNPTSINFKTAIADTKPRTLTPEDVSFFDINGMETYRCYAGPISMDATDKDHLSASLDTNFRQETVFFRVLQKGNNLALYAYIDNLKARFYIGEGPDYSPTELIYRVYHVYGTMIHPENTYMKQLFALANKYQVLDSGLQWDIEHAGYNKDGMLDIVSKINHISKADKKKLGGNAPAFNLFLSAAVNITNFSTVTGSSFYNAGGRSNTSYLPAASFGINIFANPNTRRLQFRVEVGVAQGQFNSLYKLQVSPYIPFKASFNETAFSIAPQVIYNFYNGDNLKVYGGLGVSINYFKYSKPYLGSQSQPNSAADIETNEPYLFIASDDAFMFKAGVQFAKNWGIFAQYLTSVNITKNSYYQLSSTCEQVGINYFFK